jgi:hypothetical protein
VDLSRVDHLFMKSTEQTIHAARVAARKKYRDRLVPEHVTENYMLLSRKSLAVLSDVAQAINEMQRKSIG